MRTSFTYEGKRYWIRGKSPEDVAAKKALKLRDLAEQVKIESTMLTRAWALEWLETYKRDYVIDKSYNDYKSRLTRHILPHIGHLQLRQVKPIHLRKIMQEMKGYSGSRIDKVHQCVCQLFAAAWENDLIRDNPAKGLKKPAGDRGSHRSITPQEREIILRVAETHQHGLWVLVMLYCGLRTGETARVRVKDFDHKGKKLYIDGTKTSNASRYVPVPQELLDKVKALGKDPFEHVFTNDDGIPIKPHNRGRMWKSFKKAMHVEMGGKLYNRAVVPPYLVADDLVPYCLRHTYCTDLQDAGIPINVAKELMGHSDISLTAKIYTHYTDVSFQSAADKLESYRSRNGTPNGTLYTCQQPLRGDKPTKKAAK